MSYHPFLKWVIVLPGLLLMLSCSLPQEPGPMPRQIVDTQYEPMLNVFGILRNDGIAGSSFFHVERFITTGEMYSMDADVVVRNAIVTVTDIETDSVTLFTIAEDSLHDGYYFNTEFTAEAGHSYRALITAEGYPDLSSTLPIPAAPIVSSINADPTRSLTVINLYPDTLAAEYEILTYSSGETRKFYTQPDGDGNVLLPWTASATPPDSAEIYATDANLRRYRLASPSIIPQTFHEDGSTVDGGLGVIGGLSRLILRF